ncbi:MAG TPA: UbiD family decarboxylase [Candidatus Syntrophoarchaeum butanivorans]|uniref:Anhydromevalonate phosphate decarboxylase n=1 Tax=Candidatus Syntropharchaeum butanivorans TaxID=1839936 RepID=A0A7C1B7E8_9EURY|nr:UbiD family decarboxylase [Candidatus Syntrophoarchaeum butanivorans]
MGLREFMNELKERGDLVEIDDPVSSDLDACRIAREIERPILFKNLSGMRACINLISSREILSRVLGVEPDKIAPRLADLPLKGEVRIVDDSPAREVIRRADLSTLPIMRFFERDGGAYITAGIIVTEFDGVRNASFHRMMVIGKNKVVARLVPPRHTYMLHKKAKEQGKGLKVGIVIGPDPVILFAAATRVEPGREFEYASALRGGPVELFRLDNGICVPHAEIVLEGEIERDECAREGPFVDITGTYDRVRLEPVITLDKIYHREDPIYHSIIPGGMEHQLLMGVPYEPVILRGVRHVADARNVILTRGGCTYLHAAVSIQKVREGDGKNAIIAAFAAAPSLKQVVVVDEDIDILDPIELEYAIATRVRWDEDLVMVRGARGSSLDPSAAEDGTSTKVGIDATKPLGRRGAFERVTS